MPLIWDIYSLIWGGTASVVGYGVLDCGVCNYECVMWAWEVSGYSQENPESLHVQCDYCGHTSNSHHPKAASLHSVPSSAPREHTLNSAYCFGGLARWPSRHRYLHSLGCPSLISGTQVKEAKNWLPQKCPVTTTCAPWHMYPHVIVGVRHSIRNSIKGSQH